MGYHKTEIEKGIFGEFSKIKEEFLEAQDALEQNNHIMLLVELSDLLGAIDAYVGKFKLTLDDLIIMKNATKGAFEDGTRTPREIDTLKDLYSFDDVQDLIKIMKKDPRKRSSHEINKLMHACLYAENTQYQNELKSLGFPCVKNPFTGLPIWLKGSFNDDQPYIMFDPLLNQLSTSTGQNFKIINVGDLLETYNIIWKKMSHLYK